MITASHSITPIKDLALIKAKVLSWLKQFNTFCLLENNQYHHAENNYEFLVAAGVSRAFQSSDRNALNDFQYFLSEKKCWLFGHLSYELKTEENLQLQTKNDLLQFPDINFFEPEIVIYIANQSLHIHAENAEEILLEIEKTDIASPVTISLSHQVKKKIEKDEYIQIIKKLQNHIHRGDCYEINFCQEFFIENIKAEAFDLYLNLNKISPNPFSGFYRLDDKWLVCASPERFLHKKGTRIISQPIKGTLPRNKFTETEFERLTLLNSSKDRAENVMVVDLVRNDLSKICVEGSVKADELFGIYSFPQVHQMISTISGQVKEEANFAAIINATFPMGSMTGAPKINVLEMINRYEKSKRGIFSGALGYISPEFDFDFNVVIRSMVYNQSTKYLSWQTGSGITFYSDAEKEWEECMVKGKAIEKILGK